MAKSLTIKNVKLFKLKFPDLMSVCLITVSLILILLMLDFCRYGFDFTDEGYYMNSIKNPFLYKYTTTQFGFIYHPIYSLLEGDIVLLRQFNILLTFILGTILFYTTLSCFRYLGNLTGFQISSLSIGFGFVSLTNNIWLITPSYNSLAFQGIIITLIGLIKSTFSEEKKMLYLFLISIGGWITFMAKPTSSIILAFLVCIFLIINKRMTKRELFIIFGFALFMGIVSAILIDGSVYKFILRLYNAKKIISFEGSTKNWSHIIRYDTLNLPNQQIFYILVFSLLTLFNCGLNYIQNTYISILVGIINICIMFFSVTILLSGIIYSTYLYFFLGGYYFSIIFSSILLTLYDYFSKKIKVSFRYIISILIIILMVFAYSFGTNNNYWDHGVRASVFYVLGSAILILLIDNKKQYTRLLALLLASCLVSTIIISNSIALPYRQQKFIHNNNYKGDFGELGNRLMLTKDFASYIENAYYLSKENGFTKNTPVIDLSGQSPGLLYAIGANSIGNPWLIGGGSHSEKQTVDRLKSVDYNSIKTSWLLTEPDGPRNISIDILSELGLDITNFEIVATWVTPTDAGGYKESRRQYLMKPLD